MQINCVKKQQRVNNNGRVRLRRSVITTTEAECPKRYRELSDFVPSETVSADDLDLGAQPAGADFSGGDDVIDVTGVDEVVQSVTVTVPGPGVVIVNASGYFDNNVAGNSLGRCEITTGTSISFDAAILSTLSSNNAFMSFAGTRGFAVNAGENTFNLVCNEFSGDVSVGDPTMTAIYTPQQY